MKDGDGEPAKGGTDPESGTTSPGNVRQVTVKTASDILREREDDISWFPYNKETTDKDTGVVTKPDPMTWFRFFFLLFEHPDACIVSKYVSAFIFLLILVSSVSAWIETIPGYQYPIHPKIKDVEDGLPIFDLINTFCMVCFLAEYMIRAIAVFGEDVSPWRDIELDWPREQEKDKRGQDMFNDDNTPIMRDMEDNPFLAKNGAWCCGLFNHGGFRHPEYAPNSQRMGGGWKFYYWFFKPLSMIDLLAVLPFLFDILQIAKHMDGLVSLRYFRLVRIFRVLKLQKQTIAVALFVNTIKLSAGPLMVLMFFVMMAIVVFGSIVYQVEQGDYCPPAKPDPDTFYKGVVNGDTTTLSIMSNEDAIAAGHLNEADFEENVGDHGLVTCKVGSGGATVATCCSPGDSGCYCRLGMMGDSAEESPFFSTFISMWWVLTTITTVGYGDMFPTTLLGRFVGAAAMILGVVGFAMPISIIGTAFEEEYHRLAAKAGAIDKLLVDHEAALTKKKQGDYPSVPGGQERDAKEAQELFTALCDACKASNYSVRDLANYANECAKKQNTDKAA